MRAVTCESVILDFWLSLLHPRAHLIAGQCENAATDVVIVEGEQVSLCEGCKVVMERGEEGAH